MSETKWIDPRKIIIREFKIAQSNIVCPDEFDVKNIASFDYEVNLDTGCNLAESLIKAEFFVSVSTVSQEKAEEATGALRFVFMYYYEALAEHTSLRDDGVVEWNPYLANAIASVTYSTSRGVLMARFQGTALRDFILPVVDPDGLVGRK